MFTAFIALIKYRDAGSSVFVDASERVDGDDGDDGDDGETVVNSGSALCTGEKHWIKVC